MIKVAAPTTEKPMPARVVALYVALALAVSWILQLAAIGLWGLEGAGARLMFVVAMWSPTLIAIAFIAFHRTARRDVLWRLGRPFWLTVGITAETAIAFIMVAGLVSTGAATTGWFAFETAGVTVSGGPWLLGSGFQAWPFYLLNVAVTAAAFSAIGLVAATGEEFAWRGFLQGHLTRRLGVHAGILLLAAIWWAWHLPGLLAGYNFPDYPLLGALVLFPLQMIGASLFFGWLTIRSGSFWPAALAHAAVNSVQQGVIDNISTTLPQLAVDGLRTALILALGLLCWAPLAKVHPPYPKPVRLG